MSLSVLILDNESRKNERVKAQLNELSLLIISSLFRWLSLYEKNEHYLQI